jgi:ribose transport system substrate-binding protein
MKRMRSAIALAVVAGGMAAIVSTTASAAHEVAHTASSKSITVVLGVTGFQYYTALGCGAQAEGKKLGVSVKVDGPSSFAATAQIPVVNSVTASHPGAAIVAPDDVTALLSPLRQMQSAGVKLVEVDTATVPALGVTQITSDNAQAGSLGATTIASLMHDKGTILVVSTAPGVSTEDLRIKEFKKVLAKYPNLHIISTQYDDANPETSVSDVSGVLSAHPTLGGIFTTNLLSTEGVETALKQTHTAGKIQFVGSDGAAEQLADLKANVMQGIVLQMPFKEGELSVQAAYDALSGKKVPAPRQVGVVALTKRNLRTNAKFIYQSHC